MPNFSDRLNPAFGELNPIEDKFIRDNYNNNISTGIGSLRYSIEQTYSSDVISKLGGPLRGIVLRVDDERTCQKANSLMSRIPVYRENPALVSIKVRIPELHSALPNPLAYGTNQNNSQFVIDNYPSFVAVNEEISNKPVYVGDIVLVDFANRENLTEPLYYGVVYSRPSPGVAGQNERNPNRQAFFQKGQLQSLQSLARQQEDNGRTNLSQRPPRPSNQEWTYIRGVKQKLINLKEVSLEFASGEGRKINEEHYDAIIRMLKDARSAGHSIKVSSGFRTWDEQNWFYQKYLRGEGNLAANPNRTGPSSHLAGNNYDFSGMGNGKSSAFIWMAQNAHKYGLWNEGKDFRQHPEAWHWAFTGINSSQVINYSRLSLEEKQRPFR